MMKIRIITPAGIVDELDATILNITTPEGMRGILSHLIPLVTSISIGKMTIGNENYDHP